MNASRNAAVDLDELPTEEMWPEYVFDTEELTRLRGEYGLGQRAESRGDASELPVARTTRLLQNLRRWL